MNNLITIRGIAVFSLLLVSSVILQTQKVYGKDAYWTGYDNARDDYLEGKSKNSHCSPNVDDPSPDAYCAWYIAGYESGWGAASILYKYGENRDSTYSYAEDSEGQYDDDDDDDN